MTEKAGAQSACAQLGVDCSHPASDSLPTSTSAPVSTTTTRVTAPKVDTNAAIRDQVTTTLADAFVQLLFSNNARAEQQKQQMMAELEAKQAVAAQQQQIAEAARIEAICDRLSTKLKLSRTSRLQLNDFHAPTASLHLKLGDGSEAGRGQINHAPVVYRYNQNGYAYLNGKAIPSSELNGNAGQAQSAGSPNDAGAAQDQAVAALDPQKMTPQQLADSAEAFDRLPPEEQQRLIDHAQQKAQLAAASQESDGGQPPTPAAGQLQQIAGASQAAAADSSLEGGREKAGIGFDRAVTGATSSAPVAISGSTVALPTTAVGRQGSIAPSTQAAPQAKASIGSPTPFFGNALSAPTLIPQAAPTTTSTGSPKASANYADAAPCPAGVEELILSRQQLQTELVTRRVQLESLKNSILRLNRTIQLDQQQLAEWQAEAQAGYDRCAKEVWDLPTQLLLNHVIEGKEKEFGEIGEKNLTAHQKQQQRWLNRAKELKSFSDFKKWALEDESSRVFFRDGIRTLTEMVPLNPGPASLVRTLEALGDNAYDYVDLSSTWDRIQQLDHNSDQYLTLVHRNGEKMRELVTRINQIEAQLHSAPETPLDVPACHKVAGGSVAAR